MKRLLRSFSNRVQLPKLDTLPLERVRNYFHPFLLGGGSEPDKVVSFMQEASLLVPGGVHFADNLFTWGRNNSMLEDAAFKESWEKNNESEADRAIVWRRYILASLAHHCVQLEGEFVECGAYTGVGVKTIVDYLGGEDFPKTFWMYDLFEHKVGMAHHSMPQHGKDLYERVKQKFRSYPMVKIVKGRIPEVFEDQSPTAIAYLHIDLNEAPAEIAVLEALFDRVVPGGAVVLDDYEWSHYRLQKQAEDPWFERRNYRVIPLPTGQGIVIKR